MNSHQDRYHTIPGKKNLLPTDIRDAEVTCDGVGEYLRQPAGKHQEPSSQKNGLYDSFYIVFCPVLRTLSSLSAHRGRDVICLYKPKSEVRLPFLGTVWCELTPPAGLSETQRLRVSVSSL